MDTFLGAEPRVGHVEHSVLEGGVGVAQAALGNQTQTQAIMEEETEAAGAQLKVTVTHGKISTLYA